MIILNEKPVFPPVAYADAEGVLAIGGDLSVPRLVNAYQNGIFPWYSQGQPIIWYSPDPRMVLFPDELKIHKSMRKVLRDNQLTVTFDTAFEAVVNTCATIARKDQEGTWITNAMQKAYVEMHRAGHAISVEVWKDSELVAGLYGINLPDQLVFCGESMFSLISNGSKIAFITLVNTLKEKGYKLIDCQLYTPHLASLGAIEIPRDDFLSYLQ